jgi:hypothetical protein
MERESTNTWELSFVVPADYEKLEFKFILKAKPGNRANLIATEEGTNRVLHAGSMAAGEAGPDAQFKLLPLEEEEEYTAPLLLTLLVSVEVDPVSPFALAASWQVVKKNIQSHGSTVLGIPDVCMGKLQHRRCASEAQISSSSPRYALELDLQHYEVPTTTSNMSAVGIKYSANGAEDPSKSLLDQTSSGADMANFQDRSVSIKDLVVPGTLESLLSPVLKDASRNEEAEKHSNGCSGLPENLEMGASCYCSESFNVTMGNITDHSIVDGDLQLDCVIEVLFSSCRQQISWNNPPTV